MWNGARGSKDTLPRVSLTSSSRTRKVAGEGGDEGEDRDAKMRQEDS